jgi:O-antigen/teichoic acid export membrane protein
LTASGDADEAARPLDPDDTARQIRGSSLLLAGRFISIGLDLVTQILIVRTLTKDDYGAFAFALSIASLVASLNVLGLDKTLPRFTAIYRENGDSGRVVGSIAVGVVTILGLGVSTLLLAVAIVPRLGHDVVESDEARQLLLILIALGPIQAFDSLLLALLATFTGPRAVFFRKYVLAPGLQLLVVVLLTITGAPVPFLGLGYVIAGAAGVGIYGALFFRTLARDGYFAGIARAIHYPLRDIYGFTIPFLSSDVVLVLRSSLVVVVIQLLTTSVDVAEYRAVVPLARQNTLALSVFAILFLPTASRLFARGAHADLNDLYWQTATWVAVITFPIFVVSFVLAEPITVLFFGDRYASSGVILAWLAVGQYFSAALGFNNLTLRVYARVRYTVMVDVITVVVGAVALVGLVQLAGALGGAIATCGTLVLQNCLYQVGLARGTPVRPFDPSRARVYLVIVAVALAGAATETLLRPPLLGGLVIAGLASLAVLGLNRDALRIAETFPEVLRIPLSRRLLGVGAGPSDGSHGGEGRA